MTGTKFLDQPRGVRLIAATEFWERFSYYGFIGLITLFMAADPASGGLGMEKGFTLKLFGITVGMMFMAPLLGGWIADRFTGPFSAVVIGCLGLAGANFLLAGAGMPAAHRTGLEFLLLYAGLGVMILGAGMFKSNAGSLMGQLFAPGDMRRKHGFMLFYMGINLGGFAAPYGAGTLGERAGWSYGFLAAGVGMMIGLAAFLWFSRGLFPPFVKPAPKQAGSVEASVWRDPGVQPDPDHGVLHLHLHDRPADLWRGDESVCPRPGGQEPAGLRHPHHLVPVAQSPDYHPGRAFHVQVLGPPRPDRPTIAGDHQDPHRHGAV